MKNNQYTLTHDQMTRLLALLEENSTVVGGDGHCDHNNADVIAMRDELRRVVADQDLILPKIEELLEGIDKDECEDAEGWWETSTGAQFGASVLADIRALFAPR